MTQARERKPDTPRRVRQGIKLRARDGVVPSTPLSDALMALIEGQVPPDELGEGLGYARQGQIVSLTVVAGAVKAQVQGRAARPYETSVSVPVFRVSDWDGIIEGMATEAAYLVKLLADELPGGAEALLASFGLSLLPEPPETITVECSCAAAGRCRHVAAVGCVLAERLAQTPLLVFSLRGMPAERLLERVREARVLQTRGVASAHVDPMIPESRQDPADLATCVDSFWRPGPKLAELEQMAPPRHVDHALLRRLGPSPLRGRFPLVGLLASIYDSVAAHAVRVRDQAEGISGGESEEDAPE